MVPALLVPMPELPRTPNGKINRQSLPMPEVLQNDPGAGLQTSATPTEATLAEIWREVLGITEVGRHENFFELGGHSLMVTQAIARIRRKFDVELPMHLFFQSPTIADCALMIDERLIMNVDPKTLPTAPPSSNRRAHQPELRSQGGQV